MAQRENKPKLAVPEGTKLRIGIAKSCFNSDITNEQLQAAKEFCDEHGFEYDVVEVAGCYELTYSLQQLAQSKKYDALVALGCLIKGETIHFEVISYSIGNAVMDLIREHNMPIGFGIITANTREQAKDRTWFGYDAAYAAVDSLIRSRQVTSQ